MIRPPRNPPLFPSAPLSRSIDHRLSVGAFVHGLEKAVIATLADFGIPASTDPAAVGVWTPGEHGQPAKIDRKSTRLNSSHQIISYAVFCLKKKKQETKESSG